MDNNIEAGSSDDPSDQLMNTYVREIMPNLDQRREFLQRILDLCNFSDRKFLQERLVTSPVDFVSRLPTETVLNIADLIHQPSDILAFRLVSRQWNDIWTSDRVTTAVMSKQIPGFVDKTKFAKRKDPQDPQALAKLYRESYRKWLRRQNGHYDSTVAGAWRYPYDQNFKLEKVVPPRTVKSLEPPAKESQEVLPHAHQVKYSHGRIAWRHDYHIVVDDLRTMKRVIYDIPAQLKLTASAPGFHSIDENLLVAWVRRTVLVWNIETQEMKTLTVPNPIQHCRIGGNVVGLITSEQSILVYEFGGSLRSLDMPEELSKIFNRPIKKKKQNVAMILDPEEVKKGNIYLVSARKVPSSRKDNDEDKQGMIYIVALFKHLRFERKWEHPSFVTGGAWCSLRCCRADNNGMYTLLFESTDAFKPCAKFFNEHQFAECYNHTTELLFDVRKQKFAQHHYHVPYYDDNHAGLMDISDKYTTWRGRMFVDLPHGDDMTTYSECDQDLHAASLLGSLPACDLNENSQPFYSMGGPPLRPDPTEPNQTRHKLLCCWDPCPDIEIDFLLEPWKEELSSRLVLDEHFVLTFGTGGYSAWRFGDSDMAPVRRDEKELRALYGLPREDLNFYGDTDDMDGLDDDDGWESDDLDEDDDEDDDEMDDLDDLPVGGYSMGNLDMGVIDDDNLDDDDDNDDDDDDTDDDLEGNHVLHYNYLDQPHGGDLTHDTIGGDGDQEMVDPENDDDDSAADDDDHNGLFIPD
ncbi:hypothetical protein MKZ38_008904 [Zalerion maritima]|uniref:F-box domain-containing protein n=1 Tax=Zalerion maritima TaxID=339359 RepID=A0AAD5RGZ4_9PEZI|nr:hypothetical protein MKZ38_008904 [Zalerion maritima]